MGVRVTRISSKLNLDELAGYDLAKSEIAQTLQVVDTIHQDGRLRTIPIHWEPGVVNTTGGIVSPKGLHGQYCPIDDQGDEYHITVFPMCLHIALTVVHEIAHFLDNKGINHRGDWASHNHENLTDWRRKVDESQGVRALKRMVKSPSRRIITSTGEVIDTTRYLKYLDLYHEKFARSYAQYIALRSGDERLNDQVKKIQNQQSIVSTQWKDDDFLPIADTLDRFFRKQRWM